jgi:hypothetical protein
LKPFVKQNYLLKRFPHLHSYGVSKELEITCITQYVDNDANGTYTEMDIKEKKEISKQFHPHKVCFYPPLMLTFTEWHNGLVRNNPIAGKKV